MATSIIACPINQIADEAVKQRIELALYASSQSQALLAVALDKIAGFDFQNRETHVLRAAVSRSHELSKATQFLLCNDDGEMPGADERMKDAERVVQHG